MFNRTFLFLFCAIGLLSSCSNTDYDFDSYSNVTSEYLETEYQKTLFDVESIENDSSSTIMFATDLHYSYPGSNYNEKGLLTGIHNMFASMARFSKNINLNLCVFGGDYMQLPLEGLNKEMGYKNLDYLNLWMDSIQCTKFPIIGNHELHFSGDGNSTGLTLNEFYNYSQKRYIDNSSITIADTCKQLFYFDDAKGKIRHVFISTGSCDYSAIKQSLKNVLKTIPTDFSLIVYNHFTGDCYGENDGSLYTQVEECLDYIKDSGVNFIAWIGGHNHADMCYTYKNMIVISCLQSGFWTSGTSQDGIKWEHQLNFETESAFSVFVVRKDLGKIYLKRFGLGNDREFNYNTISGNVGLVK